MVPWWYDYPLMMVIRALKYRGALYLAEALAQGWKRCPIAVKPDCVMPVPLSRHRWRERGYNQARELAKPLAHILACPVVEGLERTRHTCPQASLPRQARQTNVAGAFRVIRPVAGLRVALVDDVLTTGATVTAAALALREAGVGGLQIWVLAQARSPNDP
ncbi:MAG: phosphoribosyltransferase family protein [Betaproteobacteria bacterium]|nr:phosphoribosyltransferase family protein [Betaproteobacteria bacterium]